MRLHPCVPAPRRRKSSNVNDLPSRSNPPPPRRRPRSREEFAFFGDWSERYQYLIDLGRKLPAFPDDVEDRGAPPARLPVDGVDRRRGRRATARFPRDQRFGHRLRPGLPGPARVLGPQRRGDPRHRAGLHRRHRPGQAPVADAQQRPGRAARLHPRPRASRRCERRAPRSPSRARPTLLRNRGFVGLLAYRMLAMLSYQIVAVTVGWHVYETHPRSAGAGPDRPGRSHSLLLLRACSPATRSTTCRGASWAWPHALGLAVTALLLAGDRQRRGRRRAARWLIYAAIALTGMVRAFLGAGLQCRCSHACCAREQFARGAGVGSVVYAAGLVLGPRWAACWSPGPARPRPTGGRGVRRRRRRSR